MVQRLIWLMVLKIQIHVANTGFAKDLRWLHCIMLVVCMKVRICVKLSVLKIYIYRDTLMT